MVNAGKRVVSNSAILMVSQVLSRLIRMILVIFAARLLGDESYGQFTFALSFTTLFWIITDLGIHQLIIRELARKPRETKRYLGNAIFIKIFLSVFNFLLVFGVAHFTDKSPEVLSTVYLLAVALILGSFVELFKSVFHAFQEMRYDMIATFVQGSGVVVTGILLVILGRDIRLLALAFVIGSVLGLIYVAWVTQRRFAPITLSIDISLIKFLFREGIPFGINFFFSTMYNHMDSVMLSLMVNDEVVGWYGAANRLKFALLFIGVGIQKAMFPALSKYYKESMDEFARLFEKTLKVMFYIGVSLATIVMLLSDRIILLLYGEEYVRAAVALRILIWSSALIFLNYVLAYTVCSADRQRFTAKAIGFNAFLNLFLNFMLIPRFSYSGAAFATLLTEASTFILHYVYLYRKLIRPPLLKFMPKVLIINVVVGIVIMLCGQANVFIVAAVAVVCNLAMVFLVRYFSKDEIALLKSLFSGLRRASEYPPDEGDFY